MSKFDLIWVDSLTDELRFTILPMMSFIGLT